MKKIITISLFTLIIFVGILLGNKVEAATYSAGSLIALENVESAAVYYIGDDGKKYIFPDSKTYFTWHENFKDVKKVSLSVLDEYPDGGVVPYRGGIKLITHQNTAKIYAVEPGGIIRWIKTSEIAEDLYGVNWGSFVQDVLPGFFSSSYTLGTDMSTKLPTGTIIKEIGGNDYYFIDNGFKRQLSTQALEDNNINTTFAVELDNVEEYLNGLNVVGEVDELFEVNYRYKYGYDGGGYVDNSKDVNDCSSDTWSCSDWLDCSSSGSQTRSCNKTFDCPSVDTQSPISTQSCTPPAPIQQTPTYVMPDKPIIESFCDNKGNCACSSFAGSNSNCSASSNNTVHVGETLNFTIKVSGEETSGALAFILPQEYDWVKEGGIKPWGTDLTYTKTFTTEDISARYFMYAYIKSSNDNYHRRSSGCNWTAYSCDDNTQIIYTVLP